MTQQLPERGIAVMETTTASSPVAAVLTTMRLIDPAGSPVDAARVREWADTLITALYSAHPVRWEYRRKDDLSPGCWVLANANIVFSAQQRGLVVRALFENPIVSRPARAHVFDRGTSVCRHCRVGLTWAGPDCMPPPPPPRDPRAVLPFTATWLIEPLEKLLYLTKYLNHSDARRWRQETEFLLEKLHEFISEASKR